jgi:large subunit ribosomal protein L18
MIRRTNKNEIRGRIHKRIRRKVRGTPERPRLAIFRSLSHIYAQLIDDTKGQTLVAASSSEEAVLKAAAAVSAPPVVAPAKAEAVAPAKAEKAEKSEKTEKGEKKGGKKAAPAAAAAPAPAATAAPVAAAPAAKAAGGNVAGAKLIGKTIADRAKERGIKQVVFDRGGYIYHGRVKALADAARQAGLEF